MHRQINHSQRIGMEEERLDTEEVSALGYSRLTTNSEGSRVFLPYHK